MENKKGKNSMIVYYDTIECLEDFSDEQVGKMFRAMIEYDKSGKLPEFTGELKVAFRFIKSALDANIEKYNSICERNKINGQKGGRPRNPENPVGFLETQENPEKPKKPDNDNDNDIDNKKEEIIKEEKHKYGEYGWFLLTDKEKEKLDKEFGKEYIDKVITILDEQVQSTKNKNKYKDWNLVIRKAIRDKWSCLNTIKTTPITTEQKIDYNKKFGKVY